MYGQTASNQSLPLSSTDISLPEIILQKVAFTIISLTSIVGNICVITAVVRSERLRESPGTFVIGSLAIIDGFLMPIVVMTFHVTLSASVCSFFSVYLLSLNYIVILHLFFLSVDRFIAVVYPLRAHIMLTRRKVIYLLILAWALPVIFVSIVPLILNTQDEGKFIRSRFMGCAVPHQPFDVTPSLIYQVHVVFNLLLFVVGPFLAMLVLNGKLSLISWKQARKSKVGPVVGSERAANEHRVKTKKIKEMKWAKTVGIVIGAFAVTYLPAFTCSLVEVQYGPGIIPLRVFSYLLVVVFFNSAINAFIYSFRSVVYRREFKKIVRDIVRKFVPGFGAQEGHLFNVGEPRFAVPSLHRPESRANRSKANDAVTQEPRATRSRTPAGFVTQENQWVSS